MKISLNSIRTLVTDNDCAEDITAIGVDKLVEKIGAQLGAVEEVIDVGAKYQGIIIAKVVSCEKHPNADKLSLCRIDDGGAANDVERDEHGMVQVVCGAPNVRAWLTVAWLPPGSIVPETIGKVPFVLEARELRGMVSNGMLASPKELALGDNHDGILEINEDLQPGTDFAEAFGLKNDIVLNIENKMFTHRPDCFGFLGIARELAGIQHLAFKSPEWYRIDPEFPVQDAAELPLTVKNELPELVPRFSAVVLSNVTVGPSSTRVLIELAKIGQKSINNIVDFTNMYMLATGQPLHAYDYDKVKALSGDEGATIVVRNPRPDEKLKLLNGKQIEPRSEAIVIATDRQAIGLGGVMGGSETEVDEHTKNIIIESANFNMYSIRRTSMDSGLFTEAVTRFNKGQSPLQTLPVLAKIVNEIQAAGSGLVASTIIDIQNQAITGNAITADVPFINQRLGLDLKQSEIMKLLRNVEITIQDNPDVICVEAPFWRTDIEIPEDIVEEVGRLYGYDHLSLALPKREISPTPKDSLLTLKAEIRERFSRAGANEVLTYSFVHGNLLDKTGQGTDKAFQLSNALSPDLQFYRMTLMPSLLDKVHMNLKAGYDEFALFELGKSHTLFHVDDDHGVPTEFEYTGLVITANDKLKKTGAAYYHARLYLENLVGVRLEYKPVGDEMLKYPVVRPYDPKRSALVSIQSTGEFLGIIGEFTQSVRRNLKLPTYTAGFELDTTALQQAFDAAKSYVALPRYPKVRQDITLKVSATLAYQELFAFVEHELLKLQPEHTLSKLESADIFQRSDDLQHKQITLRVDIASYDQTLTDKEVNMLLDTVTEAAGERFGAERV